MVASLDILFFEDSGSQITHQHETTIFFKLLLISIGLLKMVFVKDILVGRNFSLSTVKKYEKWLKWVCWTIIMNLSKAKLKQLKNIFKSCPITGSLFGLFIFAWNVLGALTKMWPNNNANILIFTAHPTNKISNDIPNWFSLIWPTLRCRLLMMMIAFDLLVTVNPEKRRQIKWRGEMTDKKINGETSERILCMPLLHLFSVSVTIDH